MCVSVCVSVSVTRDRDKKGFNSIAGGFDERLSSLKGLFGSGVYFADEAKKSVIYTHTETCAQVVNLLCSSVVEVV